MTYIIAGDIGGTKSWLGLFSKTQETNPLETVFEHIYPSADFDNAYLLIERFIADCKQHINHTTVNIQTCCLALPGIVDGDQAQLTNLNWYLQSNVLKQQYAIQNVVFLNDFQAAAEGVATLKPQDYCTVNQAPAKEHGIRAITGAGTGLGLAWMQMINGHYHAFPTEGGHSNFAPADAKQASLLAFLYKHYRPVSWEHILSGDGITRIYQFYCQQYNHKSTLKTAAEINQAAQANDQVAQRTLTLFSQIYASWIGNVALLYQPLGGIYIAGGVSSHLVDYFMQADFLNHCFNKGKMAHLVKNTPIYLITNTRLGLQGAALVALRS